MESRNSNSQPLLKPRNGLAIQVNNSELDVICNQGINSFKEVFADAPLIKKDA